MRIAFQLKKALILLWRKAGLRRFPLAVWLRSKLVPDLERWSNASLSLSGSQGSNKISGMENSDIIAHVEYWSDKNILLSKKPVSPDTAYNVILVENKSPTPQEQELYNLIEEDQFICFRETRMNKITLCNQPIQNAHALALFDIERTIERLISKSKLYLASYGIVLAINPRNIFPAAIRQSNDKIKLLCVFTPDFDTLADLEVNAYADISVLPASLKQELPKSLSHAVYTNDKDETLAALKNGLNRLLPKEHNVFLPAFNAYDRLPEIDEIDSSRYDIVLFLSCSESMAPRVTSTFRDFVNELSLRVERILVSEYIYLTHQETIEILDDSNIRARFLEKVIRDGARCEFKYAQ